MEPFVDEVSKLSSDLQGLCSAEAFKDNPTCASSTQDLSESEAKHNDLENNFVEVLEQCNDLKECVNYATNILETERKRVVQLQSQWDNLIKEMIKITNQQLADLKSKLDDSQQKMRIASTEILDLKIQLAESLAGSDNFKRDIEKLLEKNQSLLYANDELMEELMDFQSKTKACRDTVGLLKCEIHKLKHTQEDVVKYKAQIEILSNKIDESRMQVQKLTGDIEQMSKDFEESKSDNIRLGNANIDLETEVEKLRLDHANVVQSNGNEINSLQIEVKKLIAINTTNSSRIEELQTINEMSAKLEVDLKIALTNLESRIVECQEFKDREIAMMKDLQMYSVKLIKQRDVLARKEEEWAKERISLLELADKKIKENRLEMEGKLDDMKEKMKRLYSEETTKTKEKYERELFQMKNENRRLLEENRRLA